MAHSYVMLVLHIVFSTKGRVPFISAEHRDRLYAYMGGIVRNERGLLLEIVERSLRYLVEARSGKPIPPSQHEELYFHPHQATEEQRSAVLGRLIRLWLAHPRQR